MLLLESYNWIIFPSPTKPFEFLLRRRSNGGRRSRLNLKSPARRPGKSDELTKGRYLMSAVRYLGALDTGQRFWSPNSRFASYNMKLHSCSLFLTTAVRFQFCWVEE